MHTKILSTIFLKPSTLRIGMTRNNGENRFCIAAVNEKRDADILFSGSSLPWYIKWCMPLFVSTDMGIAPCYVTSETVDDDDPDKWIERNEERIRPAGFNNEEILTEYFISGNYVTAATITKSYLEKHLGKIKNGIIAHVMKPPLWDLTALYSKYIPEPFIIWKITDKGSIIAFSKNGTFSKLLAIWISYNDLIENQNQICKEIDTYIKENTGSENYHLFLISPDHDINNLILPLENAKLNDLPEIKSISAAYHEPFAIAASGNNMLNFIRYESVQKLNKEKNIWLNTISCIKTLLILIVCIFLLIASSAGIQFLIKQSMNESFLELNKQRGILSTEKARFDSLRVVFNENSKYLQKESNVTRLLNNLQNVFPEGMWAEEIAVTEISLSNYKVNIRALSQSSDLLNQFYDNLRVTDRISKVHVIYSESTKLDKKSKAILRVKVECEWN